MKDHARLMLAPGTTAPLLFAFPACIGTGVEKGFHGVLAKEIRDELRGSMIRPHVRVNEAVGTAARCIIARLIGRTFG